MTKCLRRHFTFSTRTEGNNMSKVREKIEHAKRTNSLSLRITHRRSETERIDLERISCLTDLQYLYLGHNKLTHIPEGISCLTNLKKLSLVFNRLTHIPEGISCLINLEILDLTGNQFERIPEEISGLTNLQVLSLHGNKLTHIPEGISCFTNLQTLGLRGNQLESIPEGISCLTNLKELNLNQNQLTHIPEGISCLTNLKKLSLGNNQLTHIPEGIRCLTRMTSTDLYGNTKLVYPPYCLIEYNCTGGMTAAIVKKYCKQHESPMRKRRKAIMVFLLLLNRRFKEDRETPQYFPLIPYELVRYIVTFTHMEDWIYCFVPTDQKKE